MSKSVEVALDEPRTLLFGLRAIRALEAAGINLLSEEGEAALLSPANVGPILHALLLHDNQDLTIGEAERMFDASDLPLNELMETIVSAVAKGAARDVPDQPSPQAGESSIGTKDSS